MLVLGHEIRGFELKGPGLSTDKHLFAKVARAALSMGNLRDGGHIVIGIDDTEQHTMLPGLDAAQLASWLAFDDVARRFANYADPPLRFECASAELSNGVTIAIIQVFEFADLPHLCAKNYGEVLRKGALICPYPEGARDDRVREFRRDARGLGSRHGEGPTCVRPRSRTGRRNPGQRRRGIAVRDQ